MRIVDKHEPREYSALATDCGVVLCDGKSGAFLVLRFQSDLERLKALLDSIATIPSPPQRARRQAVIEFNVNHYVHIRLTPLGIEELVKQHAKLKTFCPSLGDFMIPKTDSEGWSRWQLHEVMERFGHLMTLGSRTPFETTIKIETPTGDPA